MASFEDYFGIATGQLDVPSLLLAILPAGAEPPGVTDVSNNLESAFPNAANVDPLPDEAGPAAQWRARARVKWDDEETECILSLEHKDKLEDFHFERIGFSDEEKDVATRSSWAVGVETVFGEDVLLDFHRQLKVLNALGLAPPAVLDTTACVLHPGSWVREAATAETPPDPANLFAIHAVSGDDSEDAPMWLHTHGLLRCHSIEYELMGVDGEYAAAMGRLLNVVAMLSLIEGPPPPDTTFQPVEGLELVWLPFEIGMKKFGRDALGSSKDRVEHHDFPSGILLLRRGFWIFKRYATPNAYGAFLDGNPLIGISAEETERMTGLARERLAVFDGYFRQYAEAEDWAFLVKLGYKIDDAQDEGDREHLWFEVHAIEDDRVDAVLVNQPYYIARMQEGDRDWHDLGLLTDWAIICKYGQYNPDKISLLEKELTKDS